MAIANLRSARRQLGCDLVTLEMLVLPRCHVSRAGSRGLSRVKARNSRELLQLLSVRGADFTPLRAAAHGASRLLHRRWCQLRLAQDDARDGEVPRGGKREAVAATEAMVVTGAGTA